MRVRINYILSIPLVIGIIGFVVYANIIVFASNLNIELPLSDVQSVVEKNSKIYVVLYDFGLIQVYDTDGNYLYSLDKSEGREIDVTFYSRDVLELIDSITPNNNLYKTVNYFPYRYRRLIKQSWYVSFISTPLPFWILSAISMFGLFAFNLSEVLDVLNKVDNKKSFILELKKILYN